jgi:protein-S-isoprenylcysteine O-methyltransferase Ste14
MGQGVFLIAQMSGFILSLWAVVIMRPGYFNIQPEVKPNASFINSGPYRLIRNPMYTGLIVFFGSGILSSFQNMKFVVFVILVIVLIFKIRLEEKFLENRFGSTYLLYKSKTYRLLPFLF